MTLDHDLGPLLALHARPGESLAEAYDRLLCLRWPDPRPALRDFDLVYVSPDDTLTTTPNGPVLGHVAVAAHGLLKWGMPPKGPPVPRVFVRTDAP